MSDNFVRSTSSSVNMLRVWYGDVKLDLRAVLPKCEMFKQSSVIFESSVVTVPVFDVHWIVVRYCMLHTEDERRRMVHQQLLELICNVYVAYSKTTKQINITQSAHTQQNSQIARDARCEMEYGKWGFYTSFSFFLLVWHSGI